MVNRLITLGCSLTHHPGWANFLSSSLNIRLINLSESSSSNMLQVIRYREFILDHGLLKSDLVIWQITALHRRHRRIILDDQWNSKIKFSVKRTNSPYVQSTRNLFDSQTRIDFLSHSNYAENLGDESQVLEDLLFHFITVKRHTRNFLVVFGWDGVISTNNVTQFKQQLTHHKINYIEQPIVDWCKENKLVFHDDGTHPTNESHCRYAKEIILPELTRLNILL